MSEQAQALSTLLDNLINAAKAGDDAAVAMLRANVEAAAAGAHTDPVAWIGPLGQIMPHEIYLAWSAKYAEDAAGYRPICIAGAKP